MKPIRHSIIVLTLILATSLVGCSYKRQLTDHEVKQIASLRVELDTLDLHIKWAQIESEKYSGGLIKSLIDVRIQVMRLTHNLVEHHIAAIESGTPVRDTVLSASPDSTLVRQLDEEIAKQTIEVRAAQISAEGYGGLIGALRETRLITEENTLAILRQKRVMAKYGIPFPSVPSYSVDSNAKETDAPTRTDDTGPQLSEQPKPHKRIEIVDIDSRVTETNNTWHKYAWKLTRKNLSENPIACDAKVEFQDSDGFVVDDDTEYNLLVPAKQSKTFTGYTLITASAAMRVDNVNAKVSIR